MSQFELDFNKSFFFYQIESELFFINEPLCSIGLT